MQTQSKKNHIVRRLFLFLTVAILLLASACGQAQQQPQPVEENLPAATVTPEIALPVETPANEAVQQGPGKARFVTYIREEKVFRAYDAQGQVVYTIAAPGLEYYPTPWTVSVGDGYVYYMTDKQKNIMRATVNEAVIVDVPIDPHIYAMAVSPDGTKLAWSSFYGSEQPPYSKLWIANIDGSDAREVLTYKLEQTGGAPNFNAAFNLMPIQWTADGRLLFERALTGLGGYIPFFGHNSLYSYDPSTSQIETIIPAEENHGLCLESAWLEYGVVAFNCSPEGPGIVLRGLKDYSDTRLPAVEGYPLAGTVHYSPSGQWIAYAVARGNPDAEAGQVMVIPADLSSGPSPVARSESSNAYIHVEGWLDEDTILYSQSDGVVLTVRRDGSKATPVGSGLFVGLLP